MAEVLITLGIIGVVAALTMPTLIANYQKKQTETMVKSTFSILNNALEMAKKDYGTDIDNWEILNQGEVATRSEHFAKHYLIPYLKVVEECGNSESSKCSYEGTLLNGTEEIPVFGNISKAYAFILNNGVIVTLTVDYNASHDADNVIRPWMFFDINGRKKPNQIGKDIFRIELGAVQNRYSLNKFLPYGYDIKSDCSQYVKSSLGEACNKNATGGYCLAKIMCDGWRIMDDYPW